MSAKNTLAIVLARSGSKRIPQKNIRLFCGKPMLAWPILIAAQSKLFEDVVISTDDSDYAQVAIEFGASFYGLRPENLSDDHTASVTVMKYEILQYKERTGHFPEFLCTLYGTSVFVTEKILKKAFRVFGETNSDMVMAVSEYPHPIERSLIMDDNGNLKYKTSEFAGFRTQDLPPSYYDIGLMYLFKVAAFLEKGGDSIVSLTKSPVVVPKQFAVDIDDEADWKLAELIAQQLTICSGIK